jgi:hypothetical protein
MTICTLGKEWADPTKIPVDKIAEGVALPDRAPRGALPTSWAPTQPTAAGLTGMSIAG